MSTSPTPPSSESAAVTPEALVIQTIQENPELVQRYAGGDAATLSVLQDKAVALAAGRVSEHEVKDTLLRTLGAGI